MTEPRDPVERELESIRLPDVSADLRMQIARMIKAEAANGATHENGDDGAEIAAGRPVVARVFNPCKRRSVRERSGIPELFMFGRDLHGLKTHATISALLAAAACIVLAILWFHNRQTEQKHWTQQVVLPHHIAATTPDRAFAPITLAAYTRAAAESSEEVDSLLNADAARSLAPDESREIRALARSLDHP